MVAPRISIFWLQYAIATLTLGERDRSKKYFDQAYAIARERRVELGRKVRVDVRSCRAARALAGFRPLIANRNAERVEALDVEVRNLIDAELVLVLAAREEAERLLAARDLRTRLGAPAGAEWRRVLRRPEVEARETIRNAET